MNTAIRTLLTLPVLAFILASCSPPPYSPLLSAEPAINSTQTRAPRTLRLYYDALPDVANSSLTLQGPASEYRLRGLHTMAADDLMIEILDPLTNGDYVVHWRTVVGSDPNLYEGSYHFSVRLDE
ncbi:MAG: copper resistance CopC family protein [Pseudohongiellaceae bacterium]